MISEESTAAQITRNKKYHFHILGPTGFQNQKNISRATFTTSDSTIYEEVMASAHKFEEYGGVCEEIQEGDTVIFKTAGAGRRRDAEAIVVEKARRNVTLEYRDGEIKSNVSAASLNKFLIRSNYSGENAQTRRSSDECGGDENLEHSNDIAATDHNTGGDNLSDAILVDSDTSRSKFLTQSNYSGEDVSSFSFDEKRKYLKTLSYPNIFDSTSNGGDDGAAPSKKLKHTLSSNFLL